MMTETTDTVKKLRIAEIHKFKSDNEYLVLDVQKSSIFVADELTSDILDVCDGLKKEDVVNLLKKRYTPDSITEAIEELREIGIVSEGDLSYPSCSYPQVLEIISLDLHSPSSYKPNDKMPYEAVDFLIKGSGQQRECSFAFSLCKKMSLNFDYIKGLIEYGNQQGRKHNKRINWVLNTDGASFDIKTAKYLMRNRVNVRLKINRIKEFSPYGDSRGIKRLLKSPQVTVEAKLEAKEPPLCADINRLFALGFTLVSIDSDLCPKAKNGNNKWNNLEPIKKGYEKVAELIRGELRKGRLLGLSNLIALMRCIQTHHRKFYGCGAGRYHFAVSSNGDLYPCSRFLGMEDFSIGNLITGLDRDSQQRFINNHVDHRDLCSKCWARYFCGGGCIYESVVKGRQISKPFEPSCELFKQNLKLSLVTFLKMTEDQKLLLKSFGHTIQAHMPHLNNDFGFFNVNDKINCIKPVGNSMLPLIKDGDKVLIKHTQPTEVRVGDIIAFSASNSIPIHRVVGRKVKKGQLLFIEKGDNNLHSSLVTGDNVVGKAFAIERSSKIIRLDTNLWQILNYITASFSSLYTIFLRMAFRKWMKSSLDNPALRTFHSLVLFLPKLGMRILFYLQSLGKDTGLEVRERK